MRLEGYSNYEIYPDTGKVWSYLKNRYIGVKNTHGYLWCNLLSDNGEKVFWQIHRLVWTTVNGEIPHGLEVNHIDENKTNNSIYNLSLLSHKDNINWGTHNKRVSKSKTNDIKISKPVLCIKNNKPINYFPSMREAERNGFSCACISQCCNNNPHYKTHKGYKWQYLTDYLADWLEDFQDECMKEEKEVA